MAFGSLFSSESTTSNPVTTAAPQGGASASDNPGGLVLNISDQRSLTAGENVGKKAFQDSDQIFNVTSVQNLSDFGAIEAGERISMRAFDLAGALGDRMTDALDVSENVSSDAIRAIRDANADALGAQTMTAADALRTTRDVNADALDFGETLTREAFYFGNDALDTTEEALAFGRDALANSAAATRGLGEIVSDSINGISDLVSQALEGNENLAERAQSPDGGQSVDMIRAAMAPAALAVGAFLVWRFAR